MSITRKLTFNLFTLLFLFFSSNAFSQHGSGSSDPFDDLSAGAIMFPLPMHISFDGEITFGFTMSMNHGNMGHGNGGMGHGNGGMGHGNGGMGHGNGGMGHGNGGMGHGGGGMNHDKSPSWHKMLMPMVSIGFDAKERIVNLDRTEEFSLHNSTNEEGYRFIENKAISAGAGIMLMARKPTWTNKLTIGIMPYVGKQIYANRYINYPAQKEILKSLEIPYTLEQVEGWRKGDKLAYANIGGIMFSAGMGITFGTGVGAMFMAQGQWKVNLEFLGGNTVKASLKKQKLKHLAVKAFTVFTSISTGLFTSSDKAFSFSFNLNNEAAQEAYVEFLKGDIRLAQAESLIKNSGVTQIMHGFGLSSGSMRKFVAGLPIFLHINAGRGKMVHFNQMTIMKNGKVKESHVGMSMHTTKIGGILSNHRNSVDNFMSMVMVNQPKDQDKPKMIRYTGNYKWMYEKQNTTATQLKNQIKKLSKKIGVSSLQIPIFEEKLGYVRAELDIMFSQAAMVSLMKKAIEGDSFKSTLLNKAKDIIQNQFIGQNLTTCFNNESKSTCKRRIISVSKRSIKKMSKALIAMENAMNRGAFAEYSKHSAQFGNFLSRTPAAFQAILATLKEKPVRMFFKLRSEKYPQISRDFNLKEIY